MKCSLVCHDHFLYYDLPKKNLLEKVIQLLSLTFFLLTLMDEFVFRQRGGGDDDRRIKTKHQCQKLKLKIKS